MKILNLNREAAKLQLSMNELVIFKNSLMEAYQQLRDADFKERIRGISRDNSLQGANAIGEIIALIQQNSTIPPENQFIQSIQLIENQVVLELTYELLLGLRSVLNELCHGISVVQDFQRKIGFDKASVSSILSFLNFSIVQKMEEGTPQDLIFKKSREILNNLNSKNSSLEDKSLSSRVKKECRLDLKSHLVLFFLASPTKRKRLSGIQIVVDKPLHMTNLFSSNIQLLRNLDLVRLVAYLELAVTSAISDADLSRFTLSLFNTVKSLSFDIQVLSRCIESKDKGDLKIRFRFYTVSQADSVNDKHFDIEDTSNVSNICFFTSLIQEFLSELPKKELDK